MVAAGCFLLGIGVFDNLIKFVLNRLKIQRRLYQPFSSLANRHYHLK
jgi:hypothetical protein